jgi:Uma2 family endonuclease
MSLNLTSLIPPISLRSAATLSDEELMRFSEDNKPYKIERNPHGEITIMTPVGGIGSGHEADVAYELLHWTKTIGSGRAFISSAGFNLPDGSCLSPDAAWMPLERWNSLSLKQQTGFPALCPDFIIEVRSQTDPRDSLEAKMQIWIDNGAKLAWLVDPIAGNVTIYRPGQTPELLDHPDVVVAGEPIAGFELHCALLW